MSASRLSLALLFTSGLALAAPSALADGPEVFTASKCTKCHSVAMANLPSASKPQQRDLSAVGAKHERAWLLSFLKREVEGVNPKDPSKTMAHKFEWKGEDADLNTLVDWLAEQKTEAPPAPEGDEGGEGEGGEAKPAGEILPEPTVDPQQKIAAEVAQTERAAEKQAGYAGTAAPAAAAAPAPAPTEEKKGGCAAGGSLPGAWALAALAALLLAVRRRLA